MSKMKRRLLQLALMAALVSAGGLGLAVLTASKPELERRTLIVPAPTVRTILVVTGPRPVTIRAQGTVRPLREINLVSQVSGKVIEISPALVNGGRFNKGQTLLRLDPADYQIALSLAQANLAMSQARLDASEKSFNRSKNLLERQVI
ncbi:MAG: biotin/lipoyl-binding protein, partial [Deltaproteobacteria bacterium]|nr:biotin/lipoyl-binding protein [Deltaproteobacteria bacterium]